MWATSLMKTLLHLLFVFALATTAHAQTWLINLNNDTGYRGASQSGVDSNGNTWNNLDPWYWSAIQTVGGTSSGGFKGNVLSTTSGVDSINGPLGADVSNPLTATQIGNIIIDSAALGALGGSKAAAAGYATSIDMKFYLSVNNTKLTYDVSFYGAYRYATGNSVYTAYSDAAYTTPIKSASLNVGGGGSYNTNTIATLTGLTAVTTPDASQGINLQLSGAGGGSGYLNSFALYGYIGYIGGSTTTLNGAPAAGYVANGTYPNSDPRSVDTVIGGGSTVNVNNASGIYISSTLVIATGGGTINAGADFSSYSITGTGNLTLGGTSTFSITHSGTFSGTLNLNGGSLSLAAADALGTGSLALNGGTLNINGNIQTLGALLAVSGNTTILLGGTTANLTLADSSAFESGWTDKLTIKNWNAANFDQTGNNHIFFGNSKSALTSGQLSNIFFVDPTIGGTTVLGTYSADMLPSGEVVAMVTVPEPQTWSLWLGGLGMLALRRRTRRVATQNSSPCC